MLFIILCVVFVPFGFASIDTTCLPSKEVDALRVIGRTLGKKWDFKKDPCGRTRGTISKTYDDTVACTPGRNNTVCHVISVSLKGQSLPGSLPPEFANLLYLQNIDLTYNFLSGTIPPEWGSMEQLVNISLIGNRLTGSIPKELGNIRTLRAFIVDNNMMSGIIPQELGNLSSIERLCLVSNNFTGKLPASFANLTTMKDFRIDGNNFSGKIPNFIGGWTNLIILRIQASGLKGPIPPRITLLSNLTDLRISDLGGTDTHCPPFSNGTSFKNLIMRSCNLIGNLPDSLAPEALKVLDFSFNKLNGTIPNGFSDLKNTSYIYLSGNFLSGSVPDWMLKGRYMIDLSYNNFHYESSRETMCQMQETNLFSSFSTDNILSKEVSCLGNNICTENSSSLYINCGGSKLTIGDKVYEHDLDSSGPSHFSLVGTQWGISNTGHFMDDSQNIDSYTVTSTFGVPVNNSELYMSARISALSLTYYCFCMLSGNYNVSLHFAEIVFTDDKTYRSLGRRVFDIYIQGKLVKKDFDISDEAGGVRKVIVLTYSVNVTSSLEIRLHWAGKGTTYIPKLGVYGPLISAISVDPRPEERQIKLDWPTRYRICIDIAKGLAFLHEESRLKIVHRDIKATNVLLDKNLNAKISDFGLAKLNEEENTHISTRIAGTYGYMAPEYALRGYLTEKADVYSYGIVLLEIVSGMANIADRARENQFVLLDRVVALKRTDNLIDLVDTKLGLEYDIEEMMVVINIALVCTTISPADRPTMSSVVSMLEGKIVPQGFVVEESVSVTEIDRVRMLNQLEIMNDSQTEESSVPFTNSSTAALDLDLYPVDTLSNHLPKRDNEEKKLLS